MKITQVSRHPYRLRFNRPLVTGRGTVSERYGQLLIAESDDGSRGSGDVCPWPGFGSDDPDAVHRNFEAIVDGPNALDGVEFQTPADVDSWLRASSWAPEIRAAYELALLDLLGQRADRPIARLLSPDPDRSVPVHQLVNDALDTPLMAHAVKLKVGQNLARDLERTRAVRDRLGPDTPIRLDANGSWTVPDAIEALESFAPIGIEFVEQPVASPEGLAEVRAHSPIAIAADESVRDAASLDAIIDAKAADLVVLKPAFLGGIIASQRLAGRARSKSIDSIVTHALGSAVERAGALNLAAALKLGRASGLGHPFQDDVGSSYRIASGLAHLERRGGHGVSLHPSQEHQH